VDNKQLILVDCGHSYSLSDLIDSFKLNNLDIKNLTALVLTHHDHDHMGTAKELKEMIPNLKIYASKIEAPFISKKVTPPRLQQAYDSLIHMNDDEKKFAMGFIKTLELLKAVEVDYLLEENNILPWLGGIKVLSTKGHTPGHISLYIPKLNSVITGDAMVLEDGFPEIANPRFTLNMDDAKHSFDMLLGLKVKTYYCYHGGKFSR